MLLPNTTKHSSGEILTGKLWRMDHPFFHQLPFHSDIPRMEELARPLGYALGESQEEGCFMPLLVVSGHSICKTYEYNNVKQKMGKGLDEVHPFSDSTAVDILLREAKNMLSPYLNAVSPKNARRIWGFMSNFVMLDRFSSALGAKKIYPGRHVPKKMCSNGYLGSAAKV
jgi:hypothetical protein